jgi:hypothetical protein
MVDRDQLLAAGLGAKAIAYRLRIGRLHLRHRAVYAVGHVPPSPHARAMAAVLACGPGAVLSHRSAGALWDLGVRWTDAIDITAPTRQRHRGIRAHRSRTLTRADVTRHYGIPVTTLARTLLDLADALTDKALTRAVNEARLAHRGVTDEIAALIARSPGRATARLKTILEYGPTRSPLEDDFLKFVRRYGLPPPEVNQIVAGHEVDFLWRDQRLIVELDGRAHHEHRFEHDRDRDADLLHAGFPVLRVTPKRLRHQPEREAARLHATLAGGAQAQ